MADFRKEDSAKYARPFPNSNPIKPPFPDSSEKETLPISVSPSKFSF